MTKETWTEYLKSGFVKLIGKMRVARMDGILACEMILRSQTEAAKKEMIWSIFAFLCASLINDIYIRLQEFEWKKCRG